MSDRTPRRKVNRRPEAGNGGPSSGGIRPWRMGILVIGALAVGGVVWQGVISAGDEGDGVVDVFEGTVTNVELEPGVVDGIGVYDRDCFSVDREGVHPVVCSAGIETEEYGVLNFQYVHDMAVDPCILPGQPVSVEVGEDDDPVVVRRARDGPA